MNKTKTMKICYLYLLLLLQLNLSAQSTKGITGKPDTGYTTFKAFKDVKKSKQNASFAEAERLKKQMKEDAFFALAGSIGEADADQMMKDIESSRTTKEMDTSWTD